MPLLIWAANESGVPYYWNRRFVDYGLPAPVGSDQLACLPGVHPDDFQHAREAWDLAVRTARPGATSVRLRVSRDGHVLRSWPTQASRWSGVPNSGVQRQRCPASTASLQRQRNEAQRMRQVILKTGLALKKLRQVELTDWDRTVERQLDRLERLAWELARLQRTAAPVLAPELYAAA